MLRRSSKTTTITSREFNQDKARAKRAAKLGPVIITDRGEPRFVLQTFEEYEKTRQKPRMLGDIRGIEGLDDDKFELPPRTAWGFRNPFED